MLRTALAISELGFSPSGVRVCPMKVAVQVLNLILSGLSLSPCCERRSTLLQLYYSAVMIMCCLRQSFVCSGRGVTPQGLS